jgi:lipopolysaccharide O-acetyltransferase
MSLAQDGLYLFVKRGFAMPFTALRNRMLAAKLGVNKISIGPRANLRGLSCVRMGEDFIALDGFWLEAITRYSTQRFSPQVLIGNRVRVSQWVHIAATHYVEIGDDVLIGSKVIITDHNHGRYSTEHSSPHTPPALRPLETGRRTVIGSRVWLGDGVVIAPGSLIGDGAVIGANSVVNGSIPPASMCAGAPARVLKTYDENRRKWIRVGADHTDEVSQGAIRSLATLLQPPE